MIVEVADFRVEAAQRSEFVTAMAQVAKTTLSQSKGYIRHTILSCHENAERVVLIVEWQTLEDHTVGFRQSSAFADWRAVIGPFFKQPPVVEHFDVASAA